MSFPLEGKRVWWYPEVALRKAGLVADHRPPGAKDYHITRSADRSMKEKSRQSGVTASVAKLWEP